MKKIGMNSTPPTKITCSFTRPSGNTEFTARPARKAPTIFSTPASSAPREARNRATKTASTIRFSSLMPRSTRRRPSQRMPITTTRAKPPILSSSRPRPSPLRLPWPSPSPTASSNRATMSVKIVLPTLTTTDSSF